MTAIPRHENMVVVVARDNVGGKGAIGQRPSDRGAKADGRQARMDRQADPGPFAVSLGRNYGQSFGFMDQGKDVRGRGCAAIDRAEAKALAVEHRPQLAQETREFGYSPCAASHCSSHLIV